MGTTFSTYNVGMNIPIIYYETHNVSKFLFSLHISYYTVKNGAFIPGVAIPITLFSACSHSGLMDDILTICLQCEYALNCNFAGEKGVLEWPLLYNT